MYPDTDLEIYALVSEIHENVDLVWGIKKCIQIRGSYKLMRLLLLSFKQVPVHLFKSALF